MKKENDVLKKCFPDYGGMGDYYVACIYKAMNEWANVVNPDRYVKTRKLVAVGIIGFLIGLAIGFLMIIYQYHQLTPQV